MTVLSVVLIPLTLAYAIVRYRLMDVDIIFRRGYAYTLATLCVLAAFYGIVFSLGSVVQKNFQDLGNTGLMTVMLIARVPVPADPQLDSGAAGPAFLPRPLRLPPHAGGVRPRAELGNRPGHDAVVGGRAPAARRSRSSTWPSSWRRRRDGAPALPAEEGDGRRIRAWPRVSSDELDLSFLNWKLPEPYLFFERTRHQLDAVSQSWPASVRKTIADLDLTYYLPCTVRGRTIAYLGVSRTADGDYLSSVDVELLVTLAGYVGIAIENATLYRSLQRKVEEYERLKEFSENIVESINVGILAADLDDRVESWNTPDRAAERNHARAGARPQAVASSSRPSWPSSSTACAARPASTTSTSSC